MLFKENPFELIRAYILAFRNLLTFDLNKLPGMEVKGLLCIVLVSFFFSIQSLHYIQKLPQNALQDLPTWLNIYLMWFFHIFLCLLIGLAVTFFIRLVLHYLLRALLPMLGFCRGTIINFLIGHAIASFSKRSAIATSSSIRCCANTSPKWTSTHSYNGRIPAKPS